MRFIYCLLIGLFAWIGADTPVDRQPPSENRVVTEIQVTAARDGKTQSRSYTSPEDMSEILNYLRLLDPYRKVDIDPDTFRSGQWEIILRYSDGDATTYRQLHRDYFLKDGVWRQINGSDDLQFFTS